MLGMSTERVRTQIDALAGAGLDWRAFGHTALDILRRAMPVSAASLAVVDPASRIVTARITTGDLDDDHDEQWAFHEYEVDDVYDVETLVRRPGQAITLHTETGGDPSRSARYIAMLAPIWGFSDELRIGLRADGVMWGSLGLFHRDGRTFSPAEQDFVVGVADGLGRGLRSGLVATTTGPRDAEGARGPAVVIVDAGGEPVAATENAAARIADLGGGPLGEGPLPYLVLGLVAAARRQAARPGAGGCAAPRARLRDPGGRWLVAHASPLAGRGGGSDVVVTIDDARPPEIIPLVVASYGFTERERDVVGLVLQGVDTGDIARTLHLSAYTVQDHLKKIFTKVDVRSRRELVVRVAGDHDVSRRGDGSTLAPAGW